MAHRTRKTSSELLALSFDTAASPSIRLKSQRAEAGHEPPAFGWGFGWYPGDELASVVIKDPTSTGGDAMSRHLQDWERFRSTLFVCHVRGAAKRIAQRDTHPFVKTYAGRNWLMAHSGTLEGDLNALLPLDPELFAPIGRTDTEHAMSWLLRQLHDKGAHTLAEYGWPALHARFGELNALGTLNVLLADGQDLVVYADATGYGGLHWLRKIPRQHTVPMESDALVLDFDAALDRNRTALIVATRPLSDEEWVEMAPGQLLVMRRAAVIWDSLSVWDQGTADSAAEAPAAASPDAVAVGSMAPASHMPPQQQMAPGIGMGGGEPARGMAGMGTTGLLGPGAAVVGPYSLSLSSRAESALEPSRRLRVVHETVYRYETPVEKSTHLFRLRPVIDWQQTVSAYGLEISVDGSEHTYEDVFGNACTRVDLTQPFRELRIRSQMEIRVQRPPELEHAVGGKRDQIPLVWMPWQRQMMSPFLLPPELPESELRELNDYAMSFVERNDYDLLESLGDINRTINADYVYIPGSTTINTTPYEIYVRRQGVCQDFANLMICLARLLGIPARYRVGYIYTGGDYANRIQSDASHAWVELYLPWIGWYGFDPTNACPVALDHVRVACGRNYRDATPTSGTIYKGGGGETLEVNVQVESSP